MLHSCRASSQPVLLCASCDQCPPPRETGPRFPMLITNGQRFPMLITSGPRFLCYSLLWYFPLSICCSAFRDSVCCCVLVFQFDVAFSSFNLQWRFSCFSLLLRFRVSVCRGVFLISVCCGAFVLQFAVAFSCFSLLLHSPLPVCCSVFRVSVCCCVFLVSVCCCVFLFQFAVALFVFQFAVAFLVFQFAVALFIFQFAVALFVFQRGPDPRNHKTQGCCGTSSQSPSLYVRVCV